MINSNHEVTNSEKGGSRWMDRDAIAKRLVELRGNRTQKEVSEALGICQSTYAMYESGKRIPSDEKKKLIAVYFKRSVQSIFFK